MKSTFKLSLLTVVLAGSAFLTNCSEDPINPIDNVSNTDFSAEEPFSYEFAITDHSGLELRAVNGTITITQLSGSNSLKITGVKRVRSESNADATAHLNDLMVETQDLAVGFLVRTVQPDFSGGRTYSVDYTITMPRNMDIIVISANGQVILDDIHGSVFVNLINGDIDSKVTLPADGIIDMQLTNGSMALDIPQNTSTTFTAKVGNGSITVTDLELQNRLETAKSLTGTLGDGRGTISLNAVNGTITVMGF